MSRTTRRAAAEGDLLTDVLPKDEKPAQPAPEAKPAKPKRQQVAVVAGTAVAKAEPQNLLEALFRAISDPLVDGAKVHVMLDARERLMKEQAAVAFMRGYIRLQAVLPSINKDGLIDQGETRSGRKGSKSRYATYENINAVTKPILTEEQFGMLLLPDVGADGTGIIIRGQLGMVCQTQYGEIVHIERCTIAVPPETSGSKNAAMGVGSSLSYGKRYGAIALLNLVSHAPDDRDTDARAAKKAQPSGDASDIQAQTEYLTPKQVTDLEAAITDCGIGAEKFCAHYQIKEVGDLDPKLLPEALKACRDYKAKKARNG
jgi:hypothetical protein